MITENRIVTKGISAIPEIFSSTYRAGYFTKPVSNDLYRPLSLVMFATEYQLFGDSPAVGHLVTILCFAFCVVLLFLFLDALFDHKKTGVVFVAALLFALHPIHTEVVANIKSRDELLCFLFAFLSLNVFVKYTDSGKIGTLLVGSFCLFLSLLSKETSISFLAVIPLIFFFYKNENRRRSMPVVVGAVVTTGLYLMLRFAVIHSAHATISHDLTFMENELINPPSAVSGLATKIFILGKYLQLLLIPYPLICNYSYNSVPFVDFSNLLVILSLVVYLSLVGIAIFWLKKFPKDPLAFSILFYLITIAIFSNLFFLIGEVMAERFLFFASVSFCLALALAFEKWALQLPGAGLSELMNKKSLLLLIPISLVLAVLTISRNADWHDGKTLFEADIKKAPEDARLYYYLGCELINSIKRGEKTNEEKNELMNEAMGYLNTAIAIYPGYGDAHKSLANQYFFLRMPDSAQHHFEEDIRLNPKDIEAINHLDIIYFSTRQYRKSIELCQMAVANDPGYAEGYSNMGMCYSRLGTYDSAILNLIKAVLADPNYNKTYEFLAITYKQMGKQDSAAKYEAMAQRVNPRFKLN